VLSPKDISQEDGTVSCSLVVKGGPLFWIGRHAYARVVRFFLELV
jgi:hypothetical protein